MPSMLSRRFLLPVAGLLSFAVPFACAQSERHGRKYKAPPETSHLEILVVKATNGKVLENAAVIFHPTKDGADEGNLEVKSGTDGKAFIDVIPTGSDVAVQVIANGYSTYAGHILLTGPSHQLTIKMVRPQAQVSAYEEAGKDGSRGVGVQEPQHRVGPAEAKPLPASAPVIQLPTLPADAKAKGDATVAPAKQPTTTNTPATGGSSSTPSPSSN